MFVRDTTKFFDLPHEPLTDLFNCLGITTLPNNSYNCVSQLYYDIVSQAQSLHTPTAQPLSSMRYLDVGLQPSDYYFGW